ncbi:MAG: pyridoxamine 5'-phosphate oxidase family protein [Beijerinckiaceae bacterium]|nr:pyridoxamine 5'-phosphate oxidase family protein [Beijerinckiaceae bacterium]
MNLSGQCVLDRPTGKHHHRHPRPVTPLQPRHQDPRRQLPPEQNPEERGQFRLSLDNSPVLARFAFSHATDCRSMMAFGQAYLLHDTGQQHPALGMMVDHVFQQRTAQMRASTTQKIKATTVVGMEIETASGRIRL